MQDIRWKQRFENFEKAYVKFLKVLELHKKDVNDEVYKMALIQSFEFTYELSWNLLKDYLVESGIVLTEKTPRSAIKEAYGAKIIEDGQLWMDIIKTRNILSHNYSESESEEAIQKITDIYYLEFSRILQFFKEKL